MLRGTSRPIAEEIFSGDIRKANQTGYEAKVVWLPSFFLDEIVWWGKWSP